MADIPIQGKFNSTTVAQILADAYQIEVNDERIVAAATRLTDVLYSLSQTAGGGLPKSGGTMTGDIAMSGNMVTGLGTPSADADAATKKYVDDALPVAATAVPLTDGTAAVGTGVKYAREDHRHGTDTSRMAANLKGVANGVAELDANGKVPSGQLPSFVDDVVEGYYYNNKFWKEAAHTTEITGETGKIYVDLSTEKTYRWGGSAYVEISSSLALGETSSTAYRGDRGKTAYDHSQLTSGNPHNVTKANVGLGNVDNTSDATKKTNFTGSIADGNTGFVTGGDAYTALNGLIKTATGSISTNATSVNVAYTGTVINAYAKVGNQKVLLDISYGSNQVTFTTAQAPASTVTCVVVYV